MFPHLLRLTNVVSTICGSSFKRLLRTSSRLQTTDDRESVNQFEGQRDLRNILMQKDLMGGGSVDLELDEVTRIATVTLNQPEKRNAFSGKMMMDLGDVTSELASWKSGVGVIVRGAGDHFCSGGDLEFVHGMMGSENGVIMASYMHAVLTQFYRLPLVSLALVCGNAVGGGAEVATACDFRIMHPEASIGFVQSRMGLSPGWGGGTRLVHLVGRRRALKLLVGGHLVEAPAALEMGLADDLVTDVNLGPYVFAVEYLSKLFWKKSTDVLRTNKMISSISAEQNFEQSLEIEKLLFSLAWGADPHMTAMSENIKHNVSEVEDDFKM